MKKTKRKLLFKLHAVFYALSSGRLLTIREELLWRRVRKKLFSSNSTIIFKSYER